MPEPKPRMPRPRRKCARGAGRVLRAVVLLLILEGSSVRGSGSGSPAEPRPLPDDAALESEGAVVGRIVVRVGDIFDPSLQAENNPIFRAANLLHINTRESVIRRILLFREGDRYSRRLLDESERLLRGFDFLYDAKIRPVRYEGGIVEVEVVTRDVWTLQAGLNFGRKGGVNRIQVGIQESNLLGFGKSLSFQHTHDVDRTLQTFTYIDPAVLGSRARATLSYSDNSDGVGRIAALERPFYSLDSKWATGLSFDRGERIESLYDLGEVSTRFRHESLTASAYAGFSRGLVGRRARRWSAGFTFDEHVFDPIPGETPPASVPPDRTLAYPWIAFDSVQDGFVTVHDLDKIQRTEDLNLAHEGHARIGWAAPAFGSDRGRGLFEGSYRVGLAPRAGRMAVMAAEISGRRGNYGFENVVVGGGARFFLRDLGRHLFYVWLRGDAAYRLDGEDQLLLGGDNGLRGYPLRYQDGDRRVLLTLEQRFYTDWHVFQLVRVGGAIFSDIGSAWFADVRDPSHLGVLRDAGFGLRLASSRSARAAMAHVDLAFPLDGGPTIRRVQFLVSTHETF
jgi:hypothetical protein